MGSLLACKSPKIAYFFPSHLHRPLSPHFHQHHHPLNNLLLSPPSSQTALSTNPSFGESEHARNYQVPPYHHPRLIHQNLDHCNHEPHQNQTSH
ncbi:hypothetical protein LguiA_031145 [Lonicera macranthoides]